MLLFFRSKVGFVLFVILVVFFIFRIWVFIKVVGIFFFILENFFVRFREDEVGSGVGR